jgi:hypothetical protein
MHVVAGVVRDAVSCGDLELQSIQTIEDFVFGLWSLVQGGLLIEATSPSLADVGILNPRQAIRRNCNALLDGVGWMPLFKREHYDRLTHTIEAHLESFLAMKKS